MSKNLYVSDFVRGIFCSLVCSKYFNLGDIIDKKKVHKAFAETFDRFELERNPKKFDLNFLFRISLDYCGQSDHVYEQIAEMTGRGFFDLIYSRGKFRRVISYDLIADFWWESYRGIASDETKIHEF